MLLGGDPLCLGGVGRGVWGFLTGTGFGGAQRGLCCGRSSPGAADRFGFASGVSAERRKPPAAGRAHLPF